MSVCYTNEHVLLTTHGPCDMAHDQLMHAKLAAQDSNSLFRPLWNNRSAGCAEHGGGTTSQSRVMTHTTDMFGNPLPSTLNHKFESTKEATNKETLRAKELAPPPPKNKLMIPDEGALQERLDT